MKKVLAMILAGGRGKRMDILCQLRPKPALPIAGKFKAIDFSISNCVHSGIHNIAVLVDYQRHQIANYLDGGAAWIPVSQNNIHVLEPRSRTYKGTANAIYQNLEHLQRISPDKILILAADHVYKMDYRKMLAFHERVGADMTMGVTSVPIEQANRFGIVTVNSKYRVIDFVEKPRIPATNLTSMGIYVFNRQTLVDRLIEDAAQPSSPHDFGHAIIPNMLNRDKVFAYTFNGFWQDIGSLETYYETNMELIRDLPSFNLNGRWTILTKDKGLPPPKIYQQGRIRNSIISPDCVIKGKVENSILSPGVIVEEQSVIKNSLIMANTVIGKHSVVERCILDEAVNVGRFCYIGFGASLIPGNWDITILGKNVMVPPYTAIGRNCKILPGAGPADFNANAIPSGTIILPHPSKSAENWSSIAADANEVTSKDSYIEILARNRVPVEQY